MPEEELPDQNLIQPPVAPQPIELKSNGLTKYAFLGFLGLAITFGAVYAGYWYGSQQVQQVKKPPLVLQPTPTPSPTTSEPTVSPESLKTVSLETLNIADSKTELIFSEGEYIYNTKLSDFAIKQVAKFDGNITALKFLPNRDDLFVEANHGPSKGNNWILKRNLSKPEKFPLLASGHTIREIEQMTKFERVYTKTLSSGGADILLDKLDGTPVVKIGSLKEKPLERQVCRVGENCLEKYYPASWTPSFDGSLLLNLPWFGAGLGEPGVVVSRDGNRVYKIDFYWYITSAVWVGNNKLLTQDQEGTKIFTFSNDGTVSTKNLQQIGDYFVQKGLSPSRKLLAAEGRNPSGMIVFNLDTLERKSVEQIDPETIKRKFSLRQNDIPVQRYGVIGWSKDGTKLLYTVFTEVISPEHDNDRVLSKKIKIYDINTGKVFIVATLHTESQDWVKTNRSIFGQNIFEIR